MQALADVKGPLTSWAEGTRLWNWRAWTWRLRAKSWTFQQKRGRQGNLGSPLGPGVCEMGMETKVWGIWQVQGVFDLKHFFSLRVSAVSALRSQLFKTSKCAPPTVSKHPLLYSPPPSSPASSVGQSSTALWSKNILAMAGRGWEIVSNDGSASAEPSQSCLFQQ